MLVQLKELAIFDPESGTLVKSKERKTRQTFKEKPVMVEVESGQKVIESYDYEVSLSGVLTKAETKALSELSASESTVSVSGYMQSGKFLQGKGKIHKDGNSFIIKSSGMAGYDESGKLKSGMILSDSLLSLHKTYWMCMPILFPFDLELSMGVLCESVGEIVVYNMNSDMDIIQETVHNVSYVPRHTGYAKRDIPVEYIDGSVFIGVRSGCRNFSITSTQMR